MNYIKRENNKFICEYSYPACVERSEYIRGEYSPELDRDEKGELRFYMRNGNVITYNMYIDFVYVRQFGITLDNAGLMFLIPSWEGNLKAYSLRTGNVWWKANIKRTSRIFHYMNSFICLANENTLYKLDIENGKAILKKNVSWNVYDISYSYLLCLSPDKWEIISKDDFSVIQVFENEYLKNSPVQDVFVYKEALYALETCSGYSDYSIKMLDTRLDQRVIEDYNRKTAESRVDIIRKLYGEII